MKNQSFPIKLKLGQLKIIVKLCLHIKFEKSSYGTCWFATKWFYWPNCPIHLLIDHIIFSLYEFETYIKLQAFICSLDSLPSKVYKNKRIWSAPSQTSRIIHEYGISYNPLCQVLATFILWKIALLNEGIQKIQSICAQSILVHLQTLRTIASGTIQHHTCQAWHMCVLRIFCHKNTLKQSEC